MSTAENRNDHNVQSSTTTTNSKSILPVVKSILKKESNITNITKTANKIQGWYKRTNDVQKMKVKNVQQQEILLSRKRAHDHDQDDVAVHTDQEVATTSTRSLIQQKPPNGHVVDDGNKSESKSVIPPTTTTHVAGNVNNNNNDGVLIVPSATEASNTANDEPHRRPVEIGLTDSLIETPAHSSSFSSSSAISKSIDIPAGENKTTSIGPTKTTTTTVISAATATTTSPTITADVVQQQQQSSRIKKIARKSVLSSQTGRSSLTNVTSSSMSPSLHTTNITTATAAATIAVQRHSQQPTQIPKQVSIGNNNNNNSQHRNHNTNHHHHHHDRLPTEVIITSPVRITAPILSKPKVTTKKTKTKGVNTAKAAAKVIARKSTPKSIPVKKAKHVKSSTTTAPAATSETTKASPNLIYDGPVDEIVSFEWIDKEKWTKRAYQRQGGVSKGSVDRYWYTPIHQYKLRSMKEIERFLDHMKNNDFDEVQAWKKFKGK